MLEKNIYDILASYYDLWQKDNNVDDWISRIDDYSSRFVTAAGDGLENSKILVDLGCGTGKIAVKMAQKGYDVIGIDNSSMMLNEAMNNSFNAGQNVLWLNQDITDYELYGTADVFVSLLDTINHLSSIDDVNRIFRSFQNYMNHGGIFVFDIATRKHFEQTLANNVFYYDNDDVTILWANSYDKIQRVNNAAITIFERCDEKDNGEELFRRFDGIVKENYFVIEEILELARANNLEVLLTEDSNDKERTFFVLRKP